MEIASTGFKKKLTSRDTIESYNVAENKYIYFMIDKSISNWLNNTNNCLKNIRILDPFCGSGFFTHILVEYLFIKLKLLYPQISKKNLLEFYYFPKSSFYLIPKKFGSLYMVYFKLILLQLK